MQTPLVPGIGEPNATDTAQVNKLHRHRHTRARSTVTGAQDLRSAPDMRVSRKGDTVTVTWELHAA